MTNTSRPAPAVGDACDPRDIHHHERIDPHVASRALSDVILGAQDGLVNTLGVVLAVAAASQSPRVVLAAGVAAALAESVSMAAVAYTSSAARGALYRSELAREYRHVAAVPRLERNEVRRLYHSKGFRGELLDRVVDTICANRDVWVAVMMAEEHQLADVSRRQSWNAALVVGVSALIASLLPVLPFLGFVGLRLVHAALAAVGIGAAVLFGLGAFKASVTTGRRSRSGLELVAIGLGSAAIGYAIGAVLGQP